MQEVGAHRVHPALKELVVTASRALAKLDADRLEELAVSCQALNRDLVQTGSDEHVALKQQSGDAAREMAVFARILEATRANLTVLSRLRELQEERLEYGQRPSARWTGTEAGHGDN